MKVLIVSSPTGGHLYPALVVSKKLLSIGHEIVFVTKQGNKFVDIIKKELHRKEDYISRCKIKMIPAIKFSRKNPLSLFFIFFFLLYSGINIIKLLLKTSPDVIFSTGGYVSVGIVVFGRLLFPRIPIILQEQNYNLSLTNKMLNFFATKVCISFPSELTKKKKFVYVDNPLRDEMLVPVDKSEVYQKFMLDRDKFTVLIFGGSQGARSINDAMMKIFNEIKIKHEKILYTIQVVHITGDKDYERVITAYSKIDFKHKVFPYLEDMVLAYTIADLVICRAGAMTVRELVHFKKPAILIPFPYAMELHQNYNAEYLRKNGCVEVIYQTQGWENVLYKKFLTLVNQKHILYNFTTNYTRLPLSKISITEMIISEYARYKFHSI